MKEYSIKEISEMFHMPSSTIRYYEDIGILTNVARNANGQRIYTEGHVNRLKTICCFKDTGMSIAELQAFFTYEANETKHIGDILELLNHREDLVLEQMEQLAKAQAQVLRKLHYYQDIQTAMAKHRPLPKWDDYRSKIYKTR